MPEPDALSKNAAGPVLLLQRVLRAHVEQRMLLAQLRLECPSKGTRTRFSRASLTARPATLSSLASTSGSVPHRSSTYCKLAQRLQALAAQLCAGRLAFLLEGGYHTEAVGESVCEVS